MPADEALGPQGPSAQNSIYFSPKVGTTVRPKYIRFEYMDPWGFEFLQISSMLKSKSKLGMQAAHMCRGTNVSFVMVLMIRHKMTTMNNHRLPLCSVFL